MTGSETAQHPLPRSIVVVGLGYVGLPLAVALAKRFPVLGFDIDTGRIAELRQGQDRTREIAADALLASSLKLSADPADIVGQDLYIVTVPTPVDADNKPDLSPVRSASRSVGKALRKTAQGCVVVYESTVYPGVTEDICGPILAELSGLACGQDFFLGYSPERINPGDKVHTVDKIAKIVAGQTPPVAAMLAEVYGSVTSGGIHLAPDIKTAEAAKVIENAQRDINIAFMNEIAMIFGRLGISTQDVLAAAGTKWNFLPFQPGLVGGHCIGVDPYYLAHRALELGHDPRIILSGRAINDGMSRFVAERMHERMDGPGRVLVLGLTFKEDVPDLRNSKVADVVRALEELGHRVAVHDPLADPEEAQHEYGIMLAPKLQELRGFDAVLGAVPHAAYRKLDAQALASLTRPGGLVADIKGMWRNIKLADDIKRWVL
ncbi:nucleotide sugar dehydrogenase [Ferrovibrio sp.]|uniref:nucleotide sugar dehydrogenase n=1 Tax=Ferrovibrio sp. TaxID=1917215 RepID=UPI0025BB84F4|nr:nucleotide sugar dehydrogenase [Ferrovibrio sp.]MBX3455608.1 nucleotide sugar dehydrogenase [Ferrovibrio sp.]